MADLTGLIDHWGYLAIFVVVVLGNLGLPVPEETILVLAGYLVWDGQLRLPLVLVVGIASAIAGDNLGYWLGRRYGRAAIERHGHRIFVTPERFDAMQRIVRRYGAAAVFVGRFLPGLRFMAGPAAGTTGLPALRFLVANVLGAALYVPAAVGAGYAVGYGFGEDLRRLGRLATRVEHVVLIVAATGMLTLLAWRAVRGRARP